MIALPVLEEFLMRAHGFKKHWAGWLRYWHRPGKHAAPRPSRLRTRCQSRRHTYGDQLPIVFVHGLGAGIPMYARVVSHLCRAFPDSDIFFVAMRHIAGTTAPAPSPRELAACIQRMLMNEMFEKAHFIGHSFGSTTLGWIMNNCPGVIAKLTFLDPICFYVTKGLRWALENTMTQHGLISEGVWFFAMSELWTSAVLRRNFFWHDTVIWPENLRQIPTLVILNGADHIVPALSVQLLLQAEERRRREFRQEEGVVHESLETLLFKDMPHGAFMFFPGMLDKTFGPVREHHDRPPAKTCAPSPPEQEQPLSVVVPNAELMKRCTSEMCLSPKPKADGSPQSWPDPDSPAPATAPG